MNAALFLRDEPRLLGGQPVRIVEGALAGLAGVFVEYRDECRAFVKLNCLGDGVYVLLPESWLDLDNAE